MLSRNVTDNVHQLIRMHLCEMAQHELVAVDGTLGNGYDLEFLCALKQVDTIYGFDIQAQAVAHCNEKIKDIEKNIRLIQDSHEHIDMYVKEGIDLAMFNLGYLPGGDKTIVTASRSTLSAIEKTIAKLTEGGLLVVVTYPGHEEGAREHALLKDYLSSLRRPELAVLMLSVQNIKKTCPTIFLIINKNIK